MLLTSKSFQNMSLIPSKYAHNGVVDGKNISPEFSWKEIPSGTNSFVITIIDTHPIASNWVHWMIINISSDVSSFGEDWSNTSKIPSGAKELINSFGEKGYGGPQPPKGSGKHEYITTVYALNTERINLSGHISEQDLLKTIKLQILDKATLTGYFSR
jgi:Raf kinase inhibitor-like YbhB/YbcL family protein